MIQSEILIFDKRLNNIGHFSIDLDEEEIDADYLYSSETQFNIASILVKNDILEGSLIYIKEVRFWGVVTKYSSYLYEDTISFKPLVCIFEHEVVYDISLEKNTDWTLERTIADLIRTYWINTSDDVQKYPIFKTNTISETSKWSFKIDPVAEGGTKAVCDFYQDILVNALLKNRVSINIRHNFSEKEIIFDIGVREETFTIEADKDSCYIEEFTIKDSSESINKLMVYNGDTFTNPRIYYLHPDGKYDMKNENRVSPVYLGISTVFPTDTDTFEDLADDEADNRMEQQAWKNLIELKFLNTDTLVDPTNVKVGQLLSILHKKVMYKAIVTGKRIQTTSTSLVFGKIRNDLTKLVKVSD